MKKITLILAALLCLSSTPVLADVLYCAGDDAVGFEPRDNYKMKKYNPSRFQVDVDFEGMTMKAEKHGIAPYEETCWISADLVIRCRNVIGTAVLAIDPSTFKYHLSSTTLTPKDPRDSIYVEYGSCEVF